MFKENYVTKVKRQFSNQIHYATLATPLYRQASVRILATLNKLCQIGYVSKKQRQYLKPPNTPQLRLLCLFPKIHQAKASELIIKCLGHIRLQQ